jgi:hypothetical protein
MEAAKCPRDWTPEHGIPHASFWKGPMQKENGELIEQGMNATVSLSLFLTARGAYHRYRVCAVFFCLTDGKPMYKLQHTVYTNECVLARKIGSPLTVTIEVTHHADTAMIVGSMNGVICASKTYALHDHVRACDFSPLVANGLMMDDLMTKQQRVSLMTKHGGRVVTGRQVLKEGLKGAKAQRTRNQPPSDNGVKKSFLKENA